MNIKIDLNKKTGCIKPMHGVGQPPFQGTDFSMISFLKDAGVPYSRLHDVGGAYGEFRWVDVPNIFRNFDADPNDPDNYDFIFTDLLITSLIENNVKPFFRLGVTIENDAKIKAYRIYPPADFNKWAIVCEHIIRHYNCGWANGFHYGIEYWEIWNEPDNYEEIEENQMWRGTKEQFFKLYEVSSKHLKKCFPDIKVGGYGSCGFYSISSSYIAAAKSSPRFQYFIEFFEAFLKYIREHNCPLDFFSWHSYDTIENNVQYAHYSRVCLDEAGYKNAEMICNEWNLEPLPKTRGTSRHAALTAGMMLSLQNTALDSAMFYDARLGASVYGSLFNPLTKEPFPAYYAFKAYNRLYKLGEQVFITGEIAGAYAVCAKKNDKGCLVVANTLDVAIPLCIEFNGKIDKCFMTAENKNDLEIDLPQELPPYSILSVDFRI